MAALPDVSRSLGFASIAWIEHHLVHGPGDVQGEPVVLDVELSRFVVEAYRITAAGRRALDEAFFSRSKGRAKSELAGMIVCFEFLGPCRFDHFAGEGETLYCPTCGVDYYTYEVGEPVGRMITYPFIRCLATEEGQSGNTYDNVSFMLQDIVDRHGDSFPGIDLGNNAQSSTRVFRADGGEIRPSTASNASKDGGKETFSVFDETHLYILPTLRKMYDTVRRNGLKRKIAEPWLLQTSTMYGIGEDSIAERTHKAHRSGKVRRLLFDHVEAPADLDVEKKTDRIKGLKACYGPASEWMGLDKIAADYADPRVDPSDWLRYFWNRAVAGTAEFVSAVKWDSLAVDDQLHPGDVITAGFDGSRNDDSTALIACRMSDGRLFEIGVWERPNGTDATWRVPRVEVDDAMAAMFEAYDVIMVFGDPNKWEPYFDKWGAQWPKRIAEEWPSDKGTDRGVRLFLSAIKDGSLSHDGSPRLSQHVKNAALVHSRLRPARDHTDGDVMSKFYVTIRKSGQGKIDAAWAAILAFKARGWALEKGLTGSFVDVSESVW